MPGRILIVDDDVSRRITLAARLSGAFYDIRIAGSDEEAFALMQQWKPGVILVSDQLAAPPILSFLRIVRKDPRCSDTTIFVVTAAWAQGGRAALLAAGADDVIPRSEPEEVFHARLRSHERARAMIEALQLRGDDGDTPPLPGFFEAPAHFPGLIPVTIVPPDSAASAEWEIALSDQKALSLRMVPVDRIATRSSVAEEMDDKPRLLVLGLAPGNERKMLRAIAELRSQRNAPETEILLIAPDATPETVRQGYDIGASSVMIGQFEPVEVIARLGNLQRRMSRRKCLRMALTDGMRASVIDPLTGLYNRRFALPRLSQLAQNAGRNASPYAVCVLDIDHFKTVNDRFGHIVGDIALQNLAGLLRDNLRPCDLLARIGGEEFLVMLPETGPNESLYIAGQLCETIRRSPIPIGEGQAPLNLTISLGLTIGHRGQRSAEELIADADSALYSAKRSGRDQVALHARTSYLCNPGTQLRATS
ncbi:GGDEF domain-containing response regulator [Pseudooceanicola algae]|uniref:diguanylate cyclase n=1 Tax=Pseudooceanicola algae TaxID=1537215 RepID=A0A418SCI6_9RHOB|nr:diguanylate cyclase [Pseudooceanicola algae]QPM90091.1 Response regulator PleD [Pseudooceanicola algae]